MSSFKNKVTFITGAATGIGHSTALLLSKSGSKVMIGDINETLGKKTVEEIEKSGGNARFYKMDVGSKEQVDQVVEQIINDEGSLDFAVNNAGIGGAIASMHEVTLENWQRMIDVNLSGVFYCMQAELKHMLGNGGGSIVNVSSLAGLNGMPSNSSYSAAKHGVIGLTKSAALEYGRKAIRVNAICPGFVETPILDTVPEGVVEYTTKTRVPMKRIGQPEEVANAIVWLLSDQASYVNGHSMTTDGGFSAS